MKTLAAAFLAVCVSCAPVARVEGRPPGAWRLDPMGYYEDEPQAPRLVTGALLTCAVIAGFVIAWPHVEDALAAGPLSTWWYGY